MLIHVVDVASTEGRDPIEDIETINKELHKYNEDLAQTPHCSPTRPMLVKSERKLDIDDKGLFLRTKYRSKIKRFKECFEPMGIKVFPISAVTGEGWKNSLLCSGRSP